MRKRYQVFVSSTYADLQEERGKVIQTLMEMDCIPSGMELFPAMDEEQWAFIQKVIDDCDYYLLIIGGRYGSTTDTGISYTEKEYDYAVSKGIKVIALLHKDPDLIPLGKSEADPSLRDKLNQFRGKVSTGRLVKFWSNPEELAGIVALSLSKTIKTYPATGWVRAGGASSEELLQEINELRKEKAELLIQMAKYKATSTPKLDGLAGLDESMELTMSYRRRTTHHGRPSSSKHVKHLKVTWRELFALLAPHLINSKSDSSVKRLIGSLLHEREFGKMDSGASIKDHEFQTMKIQYDALNLVDVRRSKTTAGGYDVFWSLTEKGKKLMVEARAVRA